MTRRKQYLNYFFALSMTSVVGCAHAPASSVKVAESSGTTRLEEAERNNGRLTVRVEELEDQLFLLQDRVDSNRIALQRRGVWGQGRQARNDAPAAAPESYRQKYGAKTPKNFVKLESGKSNDDEMYEYYDDETSFDAAPKVTPKKRSRKRYENGKQTQDIVITEKEYNKFIQENGYDSTTPEKRNPSAKKSTRTRTPQPNVTEEKLLTSKQLRSKPVSKKPGKKNGLALYKEALAFYRAGDYSSALSGFESFLNGGPKEDYIDNALYWIGECHFGLGSHAKAAEYFKRVMTEQPDGNKIPDSILKMALAFVKMGKTAQAKKLLSNVSQQYPRTNAGKLGAQKLSEL